MAKTPEFLKKLLRKAGVMKESDQALPTAQYVSDILSKYGEDTDINDNNYVKVSLDLHRALWPAGTKPPLTEEEYKEECKQYVRG